MFVRKFSEGIELGKRGLEERTQVDDPRTWSRSEVGHTVTSRKWQNGRHRQETGIFHRIAPRAFRTLESCVGARVASHGRACAAHVLSRSQRECGVTHGNLEHVARRIAAHNPIFNTRQSPSIWRLVAIYRLILFLCPNIFYMTILWLFLHKANDRTKRVNELE